MAAYNTRKPTRLSGRLPKNKPPLPKWEWNLASRRGSRKVGVEFPEAAHKCLYQATESEGLGLDSGLNFNMNSADLRAC